MRGSEGKRKAKPPLGRIRKRVLSEEETDLTELRISPQISSLRGGGGEGKCSGSGGGSEGK